MHRSMKALPIISKENTKKHVRSLHQCENYMRRSETHTLLYHLYYNTTDIVCSYLYRVLEQIVLKLRVCIVI